MKIVQIFNSSLFIRRVAYAQEVRSANDLHQLQPSEIRQLKDFIRGKGRGTVSRVPLGNEDNVAQPSLDQFHAESVTTKNNSEIIDFGQQVWTMIPQNLNNSATSNEAPMTFSFIPVLNTENSVNEQFKIKNYHVKNTTEKFLAENYIQRNTMNSSSKYLKSSSNKSLEEPSEEDYEKLAIILQTFVNRRLTNKINEKTIQHISKNPMEYNSHSSTSSPQFKQKIIIDSSYQPNEQNISKIILNDSVWSGLVEKKSTPKTQKIELIVGAITSQNTVSFKNNNSFTSDLDSIGVVRETGNDKTIYDDDIDREDSERKRKLTEISNELTTILRNNNKQNIQPENSTKNSSSILISKIKGSGKGTGIAYVTILREGIARQTSSGEYIFVASITLIRDSGKVILVDTGLSTDINGRIDLIKKLSKIKIAPPAIDYVVTTHGHPDHAGNTNEFPDAVHFQGVISHYRNKFNFTDLFETGEHQLTPNVMLVKTPGHTSEDISVVVHNTNKYGTLVVSGDVFIAAEDVDYPLMWKPLAWNVNAQAESRRTLACLADHIVPGHGRVFHIDDEMRNRFAC